MRIESSNPIRSGQGPLPAGLVRRSAKTPSTVLPAPKLETGLSPASGFVAADAEALAAAESARRAALELSLRPHLDAIRGLASKAAAGALGTAELARMGARLKALGASLGSETPPPALAIALYDLRRAIAGAGDSKASKTAARGLADQIDRLLGAPAGSRGLQGQPACFEQARQALEARGTRYTVRMTAYYDFHTAELVILPDPEGDRLNKIAARVKSTIGSEVLYRPNHVRAHHASAMYMPATRQIFVDDASVLHGEPTTTLLHEVSHARKHADRLAATPRPSLVHGRLSVTDGVLPGSRGAPACYLRGMSLEELYTHTKDARRLGGALATTTSSSWPYVDGSLVGKLGTMTHLSKMTVASLDAIVERLDRELEPRVFGPLERLFAPALEKGESDQHVTQLRLYGRGGVQLDVPLLTPEAQRLWKEHKAALPFARGKTRRALVAHLKTQVLAQRALAATLEKEAGRLRELESIASGLRRGRSTDAHAGLLERARALPELAELAATGDAEAVSRAAFALLGSEGPATLSRLATLVSSV